MELTGPASLDAGLLLIRIAAGLTMSAHGWQKFFSGGRIAGTSAWFDSIGMRPGRVHAVAAATTEIVAGLLLAAGLLTSIAGAGFVALMLVAGYTVHRENGFFSVRSGWEYNFVLAAIGAGVGTTGPGRFSIDHLLGIDAVGPRWIGAGIAVVGGLVAGIAHLVVFYRPAADNA